MKVGRHRMFYIVSSKLSRVIVLFIGFRKEGDKNDAYVDLARRLKTNEFDASFRELGIKKP